MNLMVILVAGLCVINKIEDIWNHRHLVDLRETSLVSQASAAAENNTADNKTDEKDGQQEPDSSKGSPPAEKEEEFDPLNLDENQVKILKAMAKKEGDATIADDRAELVQKEQIVQVAKERISEQLKQLEQVRNDIKSVKNDLTEQEKMNVAQMVKIYEGMKPVQAAEILNKLEITALSQIIKTMNPKKAAAIMANMDQAKVRLVTLVMLQDTQAKLISKEIQR